jgi:RNA polymerase sigma factor (sigma-70 family)
MPPRESKFLSLLKRASAGDRDATGELLRRYEPQLRAYAHVHLGQALRRDADSLDLVQSALRSLMLALWSSRYQFKNSDDLLRFAIKIEKTKIARRAERGRRQKPLPADEAVAREDDPADWAALQDALEQIDCQLSEPERRMVALFLQGYSRKEAAERLGYADDNKYRSYWSRALKRLRDSGRLDEWFDKA